MPVFIAARPGFLDMTGKAKWDAWDKKRGTNGTHAIPSAQWKLPLLPSRW